VDSAASHGPPAGLEPEGQIAPDRWENLCENITAGECAPVIGAGVCGPLIPAGAELACRWAADCRYPLKDRHDLARVAQYRSTRVSPASAQTWVQQRFTEYLEELPDDYLSDDLDEPHRVLAALPLSVYITTNYDDLLTRALRGRKKDPRPMLCQWCGSEPHGPDPTDDGAPAAATSPNATDATRSEDSPLVFHLHGRYRERGSMVVSEDDYLDFLVRMSSDSQVGLGTAQDKLLPNEIRNALTRLPLLFIGYSFRDWNFRLLMRSLANSRQRTLQTRGVTVQLPCDEVPPGRRHTAEEYLTEYFKQMTCIEHMDVFWGDARQFVSRLRHDLRIDAVPAAAGAP